MVTILIPKEVLGLPFDLSFGKIGGLKVKFAGIDWVSKQKILNEGSPDLVKYVNLIESVVDDYISDRINHSKAYDLVCFMSRNFCSREEAEAFYNKLRDSIKE